MPTIIVSRTRKAIMYSLTRVVIGARLAITQISVKEGREQDDRNMRDAV